KGTAGFARGGCLVKKKKKGGVKKMIVSHLWVGREGKKKGNFFFSVFSHSKKKSITTLHDRPSGDCDVVSFALSGQPFMAMLSVPDLYSSSVGPSPSWYIATNKKK